MVTAIFPKRDSIAFVIFWGEVTHSFLGLGWEVLILVFVPS